MPGARADAKKYEMLGTRAFGHASSHHAGAFLRYLGGENGRFPILLWDVNRAVQRVLAQ